MFKLGQTVATPGALDALEKSGEDFGTFLAKHQSGDWGDVCQEDKEANNAGLQSGDRLLSSYKTKLGEKIWIITESDRSVTTFLLPDEY